MVQIVVVLLHSKNAVSGKHDSGMGVNTRELAPKREAMTL